jgi:hypothetical protein
VFRTSKLFSPLDLEPQMSYPAPTFSDLPPTARPQKSLDCHTL